MDQPVPSASDTDIDIAIRFRLAGIVPPADRAAEAFADAGIMLQLLHWLRGPRAAAAEPSNVFSLVKRD